MSNVADEDDREGKRTQKERQTQEERRTQPSRCPKDYLSETGVPVGSRKTVHELYETVTDDGSEGGRFERVRLAFRVPLDHEAEGTYSRRSGWLVYRCDLTGNKFAVPRGAPVPVLAMDKPRPGGTQPSGAQPGGAQPNGDGTRLRARILHPDLTHDRPRLLRELARTLGSEIHDLLYQLCEAFNLLEALSRMEELPDSGVADPYPKQGDGRRKREGGRSGYEDAGDSWPACTD
jgi:hypothetical protein